MCVRTCARAANNMRCAGVSLALLLSLSAALSSASAAEARKVSWMGILAGCLSTRMHCMVLASATRRTSETNNIITLYFFCQKMQERLGGDAAVLSAGGRKWLMRGRKTLPAPGRGDARDDEAVGKKTGREAQQANTSPRF